MFEAWSEECILRFPDGDFKAQELANAVWAVATAGFEASDEFWDSAARAAAPSGGADRDSSSSRAIDSASGAATWPPIA